MDRHPDTRSAIFLDRDGTLIEDDGYLGKPGQMHIFGNTVEALQRLQAHFRLFIVTNQIGIAFGLITPEEVKCVNDALVDYLGNNGVEIDEVFVCPHRKEDNCPCRKPSPYFIEQAAKRYRLDISRSWTIGDHLHDITFGLNAGARGVYVLTGHGTHHADEVPPEIPVVADILEAAEHILAAEGKS